MPSNFIACLYVLIAIAATNLVCRIAFKNHKEFINRASTGWVLLTLILFLTPSVPLYFVGSAAVLLVLAPKPAEDRLSFYFAMLPIIPSFAGWRISLPGVETLLVLNHIKILSLVLLLPLYLQYKSNNRNRYLRTSHDIQSRKTFILFFSFLFIAMVLDFRGMNITSVIRSIIETFLDEILLVLVVFYICRSRETIDKVFFAMLISGLFLAFTSFIEASTSWKLYNEINYAFFIGGLDHIILAQDIRGGIMRTPVTMAPIPFGFYMSICLVLYFYFSGLRKRDNNEYGSSILILGALMAGLIFSGSRGAWITTIFMFALIFLMNRQLRILRRLAAISTIVGLALAPTALNYLAANDPYGTFQYRIDLFYNSLAAIKDSILFGSKNFLDHPAMQASMQGQGIIDIVNSYVGFALAYGVPMLLLLIFVIFSVIKKLVVSRDIADNIPQNKLLEWQARTVLTLIIGGFVMITTVSLVDRIPHYLWVSLVLGLCIYRYAMTAPEKPETTAAVVL